MVEQSGGNVWTFLSGGCAVAGSGGESSPLEGDGAGNDVLDAAELFLRGRHVGHVVDGMDLGQHRLGHSGEEKSSRPTHVSRGSRQMEG